MFTIKRDELNQYLQVAVQYGEPAGTQAVTRPCGVDVERWRLLCTTTPCSTGWHDWELIPFDPIDGPGGGAVDLRPAVDAPVHEVRDPGPEDRDVALRDAIMGRMELEWSSKTS